MEKRGLSAIVGTLLLILISLVAVGIIWVVISNIVNNSADEVSIGKFTIDLEIVKVEPVTSGVNVTVKRNVGAGELNGLKFVVSDGVSSEVLEIKNIDINELESQTFTVGYGGIVKEVGVIPLIGAESGKTLTGDVKDTLVFSDYETAQNIPGLVSWWRFEGNANDEVGANDGTLPSGGLYTPNSLPGDFGDLIYLDGSQEVLVTDNSNLELASGDFTFSAWIYPSGAGYTLLSKGGDCLGGETEYILHANGQGVWFKGTSWHDSAGLDAPALSYTHLAVVFTDSDDTLKIYNNGKLNETLTGISGSYATDLTGDFRIGRQEGCGNYFIGGLDEIMVFNVALSEDEVLALYNLDYSD